MKHIQVHLNSEFMDFHMQVLDRALGEDKNESVDRADFTRLLHFEIYDPPSG